MFMNKLVYTYVHAALYYKTCIYEKTHMYKHIYACVYICMYILVLCIQAHLNIKEKRHVHKQSLFKLVISLFQEDHHVTNNRFQEAGHIIYRYYYYQE